MKKERKKETEGIKANMQDKSFSQIKLDMHSPWSFVREGKKRSVTETEVPVTIVHYFALFLVPQNHPRMSLKVDPRGR